jgi:DNA-binding XRE family transcriptional regulator
MAATRSTSPIMTQPAVSVSLRRYFEAQAVGERVAYLRESAGVTQRELAAYVGVSSATLHNIEQGKRVLRPAERAAIARALGCSIATLCVVEHTTKSNGNGRGA